MKQITTLSCLTAAAVFAAPLAAHEASMAHAHTSETTWVPLAVLAAVGVAALLLLRRAMSKS